MNSNYTLDSDSSRWWWPQAAAGALAVTAITAILVVPATGVDGETTRPDPWVATVVPDSDRPCFLTRSQWNVALDQLQPRCGRLPTTERVRGAGSLRPGLSSLP